MSEIHDSLGCHCRAQAFWGPKLKEQKEGRGHTFSWAKENYLPDRSVVPLSQALDLKVDLDKEELSGSNTIQFKVATQDVSLVFVDAIDLDIHEVRINKKAYPFRVVQQGLEIPLDKPLKRDARGELYITYTCRKPRAGLYFIKPDKEYPSRATQMWTQGQDDDSRYWFPSFDEPRLKCGFEMKVEVPAGFVATSNGALHSESRGGKNWTFHWKSTALIPSYLVTLTIGRFSEIKEDWRGKPVIYLFEKGREAEAKVSFGKTPQMLDVFSKKTGIDYPYEKYAQIAVSEFVFGGMENTSATTQTDLTLHPYEIDDDFTSHDLVSHELAHQWFGDLVTCKSWTHGWLNEGWATFMEQVFKEEDLGLEEAEYLRYEDLLLYFAEDKNLYRRPVVTPFFVDPAEVWDRHTYQKGGLLLHGLRLELGDDDFWAGTKLYLESHRGGTAETVDFQRALEKASGRNLQEYFDQWFYKAGYPEFKASFEWDEKEKVGKFKISQNQKVSDLTPIFHLKTTLEFFFKDSENVKFALDMSEKEQMFYFPLKEKPLYCRFDRGAKTIKTLEWDMPLDMVKAQLIHDQDVISKIWAMKGLAKEAKRGALEIIVDRLKNDAFWGVRAEAASILAETRTQDALKALVDSLKTEKRSRVRTRICMALGEFQDETVAKALIQVIEEDQNIFVKGGAASALGKTKSPLAFDILKKTLTLKTWNDHLASQVYLGLRHLRDERALEIFLEGARYGAPKGGRVQATAALAEYGLDRLDVTEFLEGLLEDSFFRVRFAAAEALAKRRDPRALGSLEEAANHVIDGHFKAAAHRAARRLRQNLQKPEEFVALDASVEKLQDESRKLRDRLSRLEALRIREPQVEG